MVQQLFLVHEIIISILEIHTDFLAIRNISRKKKLCIKTFEAPEKNACLSR